MTENKDPESLTGTVEHIVYQNSENGYAVAEIETEYGEFETVFGIMPLISEGEQLTVYGQYVNSPKYGRQFRVESYEKHLPKTENMIIKYLSSGTIKGIGPAMAKKIVAKFGTETFDVIENNPDWLAEISGISASRAEKIGADFREQNGLRSVMLFCGDFFSPSVSVHAFKRWGTSAVEIIRNNPYILCEEDMGVTFEGADKAAQAIGLSPDSKERLNAGIIYVLNHNANQNGHTYLPEDKLVKAAATLLSAAEHKVEEALETLAKIARAMNMQLRDFFV